MSKARGAGGGGSKGGGKSSSKGVGSDVVAIRTEALQTSKSGDVVTLLRSGLRNEDGSDKDLLAELPGALQQFKRNGLDLSVSFCCGKTLSRPDATAMFHMTKAAMEGEYTSSGCAGSV